MRKNLCSLILAVAIAAGLWMTAAHAEEPASSAVSAAPLVLAAPPAQADSCLSGETTASPTRPTWDYPAATTQCGILETDNGFLSQPMGGGMVQRMAVTSLRYGLTPKLDLRWGLTDRIFQSGPNTQGGPETQNGPGAPSLQGVGDQWLSARYRFHEQGRLTPAFSLMYGAKIPVANPAKGFGSGFVDHQMIFIASRDLGRSHFDFNTVGTIFGGRQGHDGTAQFGLVLTRPLTKKLSAILESYGGAQPGTSDRFGAGLAGATYVLRPALVVDAAYSRTYTAGSPRQQILFGFTYARRAGFAPLARKLALARLLGR